MVVLVQVVVADARAGRRRAGRRRLASVGGAPERLRRRAVTQGSVLGPNHRHCRAAAAARAGNGGRTCAGRHEQIITVWRVQASLN